MLLPGGLLRRGTRAREVALKPPTGRLELVAAEAGPRDDEARRVSAVLAAVLEHIAGEPPTPSLVDELCVADRQFLMIAVAQILGHDQIWKTVACAACGEAFDVTVDLSALPVCEAGEGFPFTSVETSVGRLTLRSPNGSDQAAISGIADAQRAERALLARCAARPATGADGEAPRDDSPVDLDALTDDDLARIDAALEAVSPTVAIRLQASCPACRALQVVEVDPYRVMDAPGARALDAVHTLASFYHWSEDAILALPISRREHYLARVDRARGMTS
jgi:hypothetical protein